jgi:hypothetical protein
LQRGECRCRKFHAGRPFARRADSLGIMNGSLDGFGANPSALFEGGEFGADRCRGGKRRA